MLLTFLICTGSTLAKTKVTQLNRTADQKHLAIQINGIKDKNLRQHLGDSLTLNRFKDYALSHPDQIPILFKKSRTELYTLLQPYGFYRPEITTKLSQKDNTWLAVFNIRLNQKLKIGEVQLQITGAGKNDPVFKPLIADFPLKQGNALTQQAYEKAKSLLTSTAFNHGYLDAGLTTHQINIDLKHYTAKVVLTLETGSQYRLGEISLTQKHYHYDAEFIRRIIRITQGEIFTQNKITEANKRLQASGYFSSAQIIPQISKRDHHKHIVPININLVAGYARSYSVGVGYGSFTGPRVSFGTLFRHVTDTGQQFSFNTQASPANTIFQASYLLPGENPLHDNWSLNASQSYTQTDSFEERQTNFGFGRTHKYGRWQLTFGMQQYYTSYSTAPAPDNQHAKYLVPGFILGYDNTIEDGFWKRGFIWNNVFQTSIDSPASDETFIRNASDLIYTLPLNKNWNRIVINGNFGAINVDNIQAIAPNFRFYAGGIGNLLGYPYLSQGPKVNGNVTGGKYLATGFFAFEQRVIGNFSTLVYYNLGNASNELDFHDVNILKAAGLGLSYKTPLGPLMFFLTRSLNQNDRHWRVDFSIGISL